MNGNNYIKGQNYTVYNTTGLSGIDIMNPNANLHGLSVRVIIRDGSDPCTYGLQYYGSTIALNINGTACAQNTCDGTVSVTNTSCGAHNGSLKANPTGASTYTYVWKNSSNIQIGTSQTISNLAAGNYTV